jgi:hypothetical protein
MSSIVFYATQAEQKGKTWEITFVDGSVKVGQIDAISGGSAHIYKVHLNGIGTYFDANKVVHMSPQP